MIKVVQDQRQHGTQIIIVGDQCQAIYGWTGAVDAMDKF
jgi:superfamily I DNA/RNA helicase